MDTPHKLPRLLTGLAFGSVVAVLAAFLALTVVDRGHSADCKRIQKRLEARILILEKRLASGALADPAPSARPTAPGSLGAVASDVVDLPSLLPRLERLEAQVAQLAGRLDPTEAQPLTDPKELIAQRVRDLEEMIRSRPTRDATAEQFASESGRSQWGNAAMEGIHWAYADAPFFAELGGTFSIDCRQSTCKSEWQAPDLTGLDPIDAEQQLSLAGYELLAVVAKGGSDIGPMQSSSTTEGRTSRLTVYFSREPD